MTMISLDPQDGTAPLVLKYFQGQGLLPTGPQGLELAPRALATRARALGDGLQVDRVTVGARDVTLPLQVWGANRAQYLARRRRLQAIVAPRRPVRVTHVEDDGEELWVEGYYVGGMEGAGGPAWQNFAVYSPVLRCGQPFWSMAERTEPWKLGTAGKWFPFPDLKLRGSIISGRRDVVNPGDVESWPVWTATGPGGGLRVLHRRTVGGQELTRDINLQVDILAGEVITIDSRPGSRSVTSSTRGDMIRYLASDPELWPLLGGVNDVELTMPAAGDDSDVELSWVPLRESV